MGLPRLHLTQARCSLAWWTLAKSRSRWSVLLIALGSVMVVLSACTQRQDPPNLVSGDALLDPRNLATYQDRSWASSGDWEQATIENLLIERIGVLTSHEDEISLPSSIHLTLQVKDTVGNILAQHPLVIGHNRWRDVIPVEPLDLYIRISTLRLGHDFLIMRVQHPHGHALNINVIAAMMPHV